MSSLASLKSHGSSCGKTGKKLNTTPVPLGTKEGAFCTYLANKTNRAYARFTVYARLPGVKPQNIPDWRLLREHTHTHRQTHARTHTLTHTELPTVTKKSYLLRNLEGNTKIRKCIQKVRFSVIRNQMLPPFISDTKDKHPTFILASYGAEYYHHSFPTVKASTRRLF